MLKNTFQELTLSRLGFGTMRLPVGADGTIDEKAVDEMVDMAMEKGINYFDTAWPYHGGMSEIVIGRSLGRYSREKWFLANKYPGHQILKSYDPAAIFEKQLEKCGVEYFDFYLLHNVYEKSIETYMDPKWNILPYFLEQKRLGRIRHLGFSSHGSLETMEKFLDDTGDAMEFCQIQLNFMDWTLQDAKEKYEMLTRRGIPVWVMEPVRGGRLASLSSEDEAKLQALRPEEKTPAWAFRFLQDLPNVKMVLSGMSNLTQMQENIETFEAEKPLTPAERQTLLDIAEGMKNSIPCTSCRYCTAGCPMQLDIPNLISALNELRFSPAGAMNVGMRMEALPENKQPKSCIACGKCTRMCPQNIDIPGAMRDFADRLAKGPSWAEICRKRDEAAAAAAKTNG